MMRSRIRFLAVLFLTIPVLTMFTSFAAIRAQDSTCSALVQSAFEQLNTTCVGLPGSSACYGSGASVTPLNGDDVTFSEAGDQLPLSSIQTIQTLPMDESAEQWGLALLNVHANVPMSMSETGLQFLLVGDVQVENVVPAESAFTPNQGLLVTPLVAANLRSAPSTDAQVLASATVGTTLMADGLSSDGGWLRVYNGELIDWISRQIVSAPEGNIGDLPVIGSSTQTLMQSIFLSTSQQESDCSDLPPSMLVVQGPDGMPASMTVNGIDLRFDGTIALLITPDHIMHLIVMSGGANVGGVSVPPGFTLNIPLSEDERSAGGQATGLRPITEGERGAMSLVANGISGDLLHSPLTVPTQAETNAILASLNSAAGAQTTSGPASGQADCSRFKPTSPLDGLAFGVTSFYWDAAAGATSYRINVYGPDGGTRISVETNGAFTTTFNVDTGGALGEGGNFAWNVEALVNGQVACSSGRVSLPRGNANQAVGEGGGGAENQPEPDWSGG